MPSANPMDTDFEQQLALQDTTFLPSLQWWCNTEYRKKWNKDIRTAAGIAPPANMTVEELWPSLPKIYQRGITYLAIIGKTDEKTVMPLGVHLQNPAARFYLDPPPPESNFGILEQGKVIWDSPLPRTPVACAIWAPPSATINDLFHIGQQYGAPGKPCAYKFFLLFGTPNEDIKQWSAPIKCTKNKSVLPHPN